MYCIFDRIADHWLTEDGVEIKARVYWQQDTNRIYLEVPKQIVMVPDYEALTYEDDMNVICSVEEVVEYGVYFVDEMEPESDGMPAVWHCYQRETNELPERCILIPTKTKPRRVRWAELS